MVCPLCGAEARRSHSRGFSEKIFKLTSGFRPFRCKECSWRGWMSRGKKVDSRRTMRTYFYFVIILILTTIIALYYANRVSSSEPFFPVQ
jgi:hypothetical protein